jgi:hypothetical protein
MPAIMKEVLCGWCTVNVQRFLQGGASEGRKISGLADFVVREKGYVMGRGENSESLQPSFLGACLQKKLYPILAGDAQQFLNAGASEG